MNEAEKYNLQALKKFLETEEAKTHKVFVIISENEHGKAKVFQSPLYSPKNLALKLYQIGDSIMGAIIKQTNKPN